MVSNTTLRFTQEILVCCAGGLNAMAGGVPGVVHHLLRFESVVAGVEKNSVRNRLSVSGNPRSPSAHGPPRTRIHRHVTVITSPRAGDTVLATYRVVRTLPTHRSAMPFCHCDRMLVRVGFRPVIFKHESP